MGGEEWILRATVNSYDARLNTLHCIVGEKAGRKHNAGKYTELLRRNVSSKKFFEEMIFTLGQVYDTYAAKSTGNQRKIFFGLGRFGTSQNF